MSTLYQTLGVSREASQQEIKNQYRKLAKQFHPDKNPETQQKFKQISHAYQILSDKNKKQQYDMSLNFNGFGFGHMFGFDNIFNNVNRSQHEHSEDIHTSIIINLSDVVKQNIVQKQIQVKEKCTYCSGTGAKDGNLHICQRCNGSGVISERINMGSAIFQRTLNCNECNGTGKVVRDPCVQCNGSGYKIIKEFVQINIPVGIEEVTMSIRGKGHRNKQIPGNLFVKVNINNNTIFTRRGNNIIHKHKIHYCDLILGTKCELQDLYGNNISIDIPTGTKESIVHKNSGIYSILVNNGQIKGDLILQIECYIPSLDYISNKQKNLLQEIRNERSTNR